MLRTRCGIVHRDLKPSNVMVVESEELDSQGVPVLKLIDFGIAKGAVETLRPAATVETRGVAIRRSAEMPRRGET
jgi:serine/threonine protein kinase